MTAFRTTLLPVFLVAGLGAPGCGKNQFEFTDPGSGSPTQVAAVATTGGVDVHWSAMDEAIGYAVFVSTDGDDAGTEVTCTGSDGSSPCEVRGLTPGTLHYVRVTTIVDGEELDLDRVADQEVLAVRPLYTQQVGGIFAWAGYGRLEQGGQVELAGGWYEDETAPLSVHRCTVFWGEGEGDSPPVEPCVPADLSFNGAFTLTYKKSGTHYPVLEVESEDGRFGQALTTVVMK